MSFLCSGIENVLLTVLGSVQLHGDQQSVKGTVSTQTWKFRGLLPASCQSSVHLQTGKPTPNSGSRSGHVETGGDSQIQVGHMMVIRGGREGASEAADGWMGRWTDRQKDRWTDRQIIPDWSHYVGTQHEGQREDAEVGTLPPARFLSSQPPSGCDQDDCPPVHHTRLADTFHVRFDLTQNSE